MIGFRLGEYKSGSNEVVEPYCCKHISEATKSLIKVSLRVIFQWFKVSKLNCDALLLIIKKFQQYLDQSEHKPFNVRNHEGNWRQLTLRSNQNDEFLAIVIFDKQDLIEVSIFYDYIQI